MAVSKKRTVIQRRVPQRSDARATVAVIFEATARILRQDGKRGLNTNRIAEVAGVSIGALYGYFPNKEAILLAMAEREMDVLRDRAIAGMRTAGISPLRGVIRALIDGYGEGGPVRRILMETMIAAGRSAELMRPVQEAALFIGADIAAILPPGTPPPTEIGLYLLTRSIDGVIRAAAYDAVPYLREPGFEDAIVRLVVGYLSAPPDVEVGR